MHKRKISVSVMCSDLLALGKDIRILEENGVDMLHVDVMDAHFVPNLTFGPDFIKKMQYTYYTPDALDGVAQDVAYFARQEGLTAHAKSAVIRSEDKA